MSPTPAQKTAARWSVNDVSPKGKLLSEHGKAAAPFYAFEMLKLYRRRGSTCFHFWKEVYPFYKSQIGFVTLHWFYSFLSKSPTCQNPKLDSHQHRGITFCSMLGGLHKGSSFSHFWEKVYTLQNCQNSRFRERNFALSKGNRFLPFLSKTPTADFFVLRSPT